MTRCRRIVSGLLLLCAAVGAAGAPAAAVAKPSEDFFETGSVRWRTLFDVNTERNYFQNLETHAVQWEDPRNPRGMRTGSDVAARPAVDTKSVMLISTLPILALVAAGVARVCYLSKYYPELLNPTRDRKKKTRGWGANKYRPPGQNRLSQDGKGGRSSN